MNDLDSLFRRRIGMSQTEITFEKLDKVLEKTAKTFPFENLCILEDRTTAITKDNLIHKMLEQHEGGLCYELNPLLYLFLVENGFDSRLVLGTVYSSAEQQWSTTGKTHVAILIKHDGKQYLVDTGFGGNLPLKPVPLNGEMVSSSNGEFRVERVKNAEEKFIFYKKLKHKDKEWKIGYIFDLKDTIKNVSALGDIQDIIITHPDSAFNKRPLITKLTDKGSITLTDGSFTEWMDGKETKREMNEKHFKEMKNEYFGF